MKVLGIDQSYSSCGVVLLDNGKITDLDKIVGNKQWDCYDRAMDVARQIKWFCTANQPIDLVGIEGLAFNKRGNQTRDLAGLLFTIMIELRANGHRDSSVIVPPKTVKKFATGKGNATKEQMYEALPKDVKDLFEEKGYKKTTGRSDLTDAYWIARYREVH